jgi:PAS domain S-box-containing protein
MGMKRHWLTSHFPIFKNTDQPIAVGCIVVEISDRKRAEAALLKTTHNLQQAQRLAHIGNWNFDVNAQTITWTEEVFRIFGLEPRHAAPTYEELLQYYHPKDRDRFQNLISQVLQDAVAYDTEFSIIRADGSIGHINAKGEPVQNEEGQVIHLFGTVMDITERHQVLEALRTQTEQLEDTLRELQRTQAQMVQSEKMSSLGQLVAGVAHEINNPVNFIYGNLTHANEYTQDLLRLLQLYQQHYPRPATEIQEEAEAIDLEFLTDDLPKLLTSMRVGADRIQKIVASLRNFSRMDEAEMKAVNIDEGIDSTLMILQNRLKAKAEHPTIEVIKEYGQLPPVECYAGQLNQVFMNILSNAIDALEERDKYRSLAEIKARPSQIRISTATIAHNSIQIRIADNGPGMSKQVIQRLFDPFFTTKAIGKGTGLGMSISYQIITERHGGSLQCLSIEGEGAEFVIEIPTHQ